MMITIHNLTTVAIQAKCIGLKFTFMIAVLFSTRSVDTLYCSSNVSTFDGLRMEQAGGHFLCLCDIIDGIVSYNLPDLIFKCCPGMQFIALSRTTSLTANSLVHASRVIEHLEQISM